MNRKIIIASNLVSVLVTLAISFFLTKHLIQTVGKELYVFYPLSNSFTNYFSLLTSSLNTLAFRFITVESLKGNKKESLTYFVSTFFSNLIISIVILVLMFLFVVKLENILKIDFRYITQIKLLFLFIFIAFIIQNIFSLFGLFTYIQNRMDLKAIIDIVANIVKVCIYLFLLKIGKLTILSFGITAISTAIITGLLNLYFYKKLLPEYSLDIKFFSFKNTIEILKSGIWFSIGNASSMLLNNISLIIANIFLSLEASANLSIVQTLPSVIVLVISTFSGIISPRVTTLLNDRNVNFSKEIKSLVLIAVLFMIIPSVLSMSLGYNFYFLWLPKQKIDNLLILSLLSIAPYLFQALSSIYYNASLTLNKIKIPTLLLICVSIINILLTYIFLGYLNLGSIGILLATTISNGLYSAILLPKYIGKELFKEKLNIDTYFFRMILYTFIIIVFNLILITSYTATSWISFLVFSCFIAILDGVLFLLFYKNDIKAILK